MISSGAYTKKATPITNAGRRMKRWIVRSLRSNTRRSRKALGQRRTVPDATIPFAGVLVAPEPKDAIKATQSDQVTHDVLLPSETIVRKALHLTVTDGDLTGSSGSSSSSTNEHADSESVSNSTSLDREYPEPPSLPKRPCDECKSELGGNDTCACVPNIAVIPPSPLPHPPRTLSPAASTTSRDYSLSINTSDAGQIPDEEGLQVEIVQLEEELELQPTGDAKSEVVYFCDPWGHEGEYQWGEESDAVVTWNEFQDTSATPPTYTPHPPVETKEASTILRSSDGRMALTLRKFLGAGSYGKVVSADWEEGHRLVAVKVSHKIFISELDGTESGLKGLKNELDVLKALNQSREYRELGSNFFPELLKSWQDTKNVYFVMAIYPWNLEDLRWADPIWDVTPGDKILWAAEMILGLQALHRMRILHRDIKPDNVLVTSTKHIIIGDYGLAQAWLDPFYASFPSSSLKARDAPGTLAYLAPEVARGFYHDEVNFDVRGFASYGFEADIWSLGVTICDSWSQSPGLFKIHEGEDHLDCRVAIPSRILQMEVEPVVKRMVSEHPIWHLITRMLDRNQKTRIGFNEIFAHPVFAHLDWNKVANLEYIPTWSFPEVVPPKRPKLVNDEIEFKSYYQPPEEIDETDSERAQAEKMDQRHVQVLRSAMGAARDWVGEQQSWVAGEALGEYDFDWTAPDVAAEDEKWALDDDD